MNPPTRYISQEYTLKGIGHPPPLGLLLYPIRTYLRRRIFTYAHLILLEDRRNLFLLYPSIILSFVFSLMQCSVFPMSCILCRYVAPAVYNSLCAQFNTGNPKSTAVGMCGSDTKRDPEVADNRCPSADSLKIRNG